MEGHSSPQPMVTTTSACSASSRVSRRGTRSARSTLSSRMTSTTSGCTRSAGVVPADSARWRPPAARSKSAADICERPAFWRQTKSAVAIATELSGGGLAGAHDGRRGALVDPVRLSDLDARQACGAERRAELLLGQRARDAAGVSGHVGARGLVHVGCVDHVGDRETPAGSKAPRRLAQLLFLVTGKGDLAVSDHTGALPI